MYLSLLVAIGHKKLYYSLPDLLFFKGGCHPFFVINLPLN
jgi:hypothetical protein